MSKQTRQEAETRTFTHVESTTCDLCGFTVKGDDLCQTMGYDEDEITVERRKGVSYPELREVTAYSYDVCPKCWDSVIVPLFKNPARAEDA